MTASRVVIDADACPRGAAQTVRRHQAAHGYAVVTVASINHVVEDWGPWHEHVVVGPEGQASDIAIANRARAGDVVVTQDWGLAALLLGRGCRVISPTGYTFRSETIGLLLEERHVKAKVRRAGGRTRGPKPREAADDRRFEAAFLRALRGEDPSSTRA